MNWTSLNIVIWLTARPDIVAGTILTGMPNIMLDNLRSNFSNQVPINTNKPITLYSEASTKYIVLINSLWATSATSAFYVNCSVADSSKSENGFQLQVQVSS